MNHQKTADFTTSGTLDVVNGTHQNDLPELAVSGDLWYRPVSHFQ
jgi:hypothetical protein